MGTIDTEAAAEAQPQVVQMAQAAWVATAATASSGPLAAALIMAAAVVDVPDQGREAAAGLAAVVTARQVLQTETLARQTPAAAVAVLSIAVLVAAQAAPAL
jgi:hypothetical protein